MLQGKVPQSSSIAVYKRLLGYLHPHRHKFLTALGAMVVYGATDGAVPFLIREVLDKIFDKKDESLLYVLPIVLILFATIRGIFGFVQRYLAASVGLDIVRDIRNDINSHLLKLSPSFFEKELTGSLISRVTNDALLVRVSLTDAVASLLRDSVRIVALVGAAIYLDPVLGMIAFIGFPICLWPIVKFGKRVRKLSRVGQDQFGGLTGILQETIVGNRVVQAFGMDEYERGRFDQENDILTRTYKKAEKYASLSQPTNEIIASVAIALVILYGGMSVISGVRTQGDFIAFLTAMFLLYEPLKKLGRINNAIQTGAAAAERIFEILDSKPDIVEKPRARKLSRDNLVIEYCDVSFRYGNAEQRALSNINLRVEPGTTHALVGPSGGGKSTLVSLLPRFYDPEDGSIRVSGVDIRDYTLSSLRSCISVVSQHTFLFRDTIRRNIAYGYPEASCEEIVSAAKSASAHEFISKLPQGYDTVIGEQGYTLSGGQRQRLAIARSLLQDAPILILDEATAALDSESESLVQEAVDRHMDSRTVIVIAHRLATVRSADQIVVLERGEMVECGGHDELLERNGVFAKFYHMQFRGDDERINNSVSVA